MSIRFMVLSAATSALTSTFLALAATTPALAQTTDESVLRSYFNNTANTNGENWRNATVPQMWDRIGGESAQFPSGQFTTGDRWQADMPSGISQYYTGLSTQIFGSVKPVNTGYAYDQSYYNYYRKWHAGLDIQASAGTSVKAVVGGTATLIQSTAGNYFVGVKGDDGKLWIYGHLNSYTSGIIGQRVHAGSLIGYTNRDNHLHLEVQNSFTYQPTLGAHVDRNWLLSVTISPIEAYRNIVTSSSSTSALVFSNGYSRPYIDASVINYTVGASNLAGKRVYVQMWRPAAYGYAAREWNTSMTASGTSITFRDLDGAGGTFQGVDYYLVASLNPIPAGTAALRRTSCYSATGGKQLCDRVRR